MSENLEAVLEAALRLPLEKQRHLAVSLIGIKPIIKCVSHQSCEHMETRPSLSGTGKNFVRQEP